MRITLLTTGTLGDVNPYLALAMGLQEMGYEVTLAAPENFAEYLQAYPVAYHSLAGDTKEILESEQGRKWMATGNAKQFMKELNQIMHNIRHDLQRDILSACQNSDAFIFHPLLIFEASVVSEKLQKPYMFAFPFPLFPATKMFAQLLVRAKSFPLGVLNKLTYSLFAKVHEKGKLADINEWRKKLGLEQLNGSYYNSLVVQNIPILHAYSNTLVPHPRDWPGHNYISGAIKWKSKQNHSDLQQRRDLEHWLKEGSKPIYFGFGSLPILDPKDMINMVMEITKELNTRAIIAAGWSSLPFPEKELPDSVFMIHSVDHDWLFPQCSCVVHHGGAGTTHTALQAGTPSIICSTYADQPFWGERITKLGVGRHIPFNKLTKKKLLKALQELQNDSVLKKATGLGAQMRVENGLHNALQWIAKVLPTAPIYRNEKQSNNIN